jgi:hypothetical protein
MAVVACLHFSSTYSFSRSCDSDKQVPNSLHATKKTLWRNVPFKPFLPLLLALPWPTGVDLHLIFSLARTRQFDAAHATAHAAGYSGKEYLEADTVILINCYRATRRLSDPGWPEKYGQEQAI